MNTKEDSDRRNEGQKTTRHTKTKTKEPNGINGNGFNFPIKRHKLKNG